ncbi:MAG TPA: signal peptidase I [Longimicrobiaceae bacterium]|nr:signal peptidase I [Longimicrobiaceae bacterium]
MRPRVLWWGACACIGAGLTLLAQSAGVESYRVAGRSMEPALFAGDLLVFRSGRPGESARARYRPMRGDVVLFRLRPGGVGMVKRVIGLPGDTVSVRGGRLHLNGAPLVERYLPNIRSAGIEPPHDWHWAFLVPGALDHRYAPTPGSWGPIVVPSGSVFVLGDNRAHSGDSRVFGFVELHDVVGMPERLVPSFRHMMFALNRRLTALP